ncbi:MAG: UbiA prenyltransferase family protein [Candidatus Aenigmarchaeota archaeon]|nr:UbiA prenyltransferase family protein [Candidatus Aenigmarchaeota archaeon]
MKVKEFISNFLTISRANIQIASFPTAALGILLTIEDLTLFLSPFVWIFILLFFLTLTFACNLNSYADLKVDEKYKKYLSDAVKRLGERNVRIILTLEIVFISFLISYLFLKGFVLTSLLSCLGFFFALSYSLEPLRIKKRGFWSPFPVWIGLYTLPLLAGWFLFRSDLPLPFLLFVIGYACMNEGFTLVNTCEDYSEDKKEGIKTWAHVFGLRKTLHLAFIFSLLGILCLTPFLFKLSTFTVIGTLIFLLGLLYASKEVYRVSQGKNLERLAKKFAPKMRIWFMLTRYPLLLTAVLYFL